MDDTKKDKATVGIEIYQALTSNFQVNTDHELAGEIDIDHLNIMMDSEFGINSEESKVGVKITLKVSIIKENVQLFELVTFFEFGVFDLTDVMVIKNDKERLDSKFARKLLNISIGGARGMLAIYLAATPYKDFTLPIVNIPDEIFTK